MPTKIVYDEFMWLFVYFFHQNPITKKKSSQPLSDLLSSMVCRVKLVTQRRYYAHNIFASRYVGSQTTKLSWIRVCKNIIKRYLWNISSVWLWDNLKLEKTLMMFFYCIHWNTRFHRYCVLTLQSISTIFNLLWSPWVGNLRFEHKYSDFVIVVSSKENIMSLHEIETLWYIISGHKNILEMNLLHSDK